jgi:hypothetical protein
MFRPRPGLILWFCLALLSARAVAQEVGFAGPASYRLPPVEEKIAPAEALPPPANEAGAAELLPAEDIPPVEDLPPGEEITVDDWWMFPEWWYKPWEGCAELGLNGSEGNSQTFNIRTGAKAKYTLPWIEHTYEVIHIDNSADGVKTALNGYFDGRIVMPFTGTKWSYFFHSRTEYDQFRNYNFRVSGDTGLAYDWWKTDLSKLQSRAGVSTSREIGGSQNEFQPELTFGLDLSHKFDDRQKISLVSDYYPTVDDFANYRINTTASWEIVVSQAWGLSAKLSAIDRYDSTPQGRRPNDLNYAALMLWSF